MGFRMYTFKVWGSRLGAYMFEPLGESSRISDGKGHGHWRCTGIVEAPI